MSAITPQRYDRTTILLHWLVAILVAGQWIGAQTIDWFPKGALRIDARSIHILCGSLLLLVFLTRIFWRSRYGAALVQPPNRLDRIASKTMHLALYLVLGWLLCLGISLALVRGDSIFGLFHVPAIGSYTPDQRHNLAEKVGDLHGLFANVLLILAGLHASAALAHHFLFRDNVLRRMT
jgi:cytochrome b561